MARRTTASGYATRPSWGSIEFEISICEERNRRQTFILRDDWYFPDIIIFGLEMVVVVVQLRGWPGIQR
jgi:hypothetical protein